ncbi:unnamed protein product, partial [Thlaspi arvense]
EHLLPPLNSDHSSCLIDLAHQLPSAGSHPFKFFNYLTKHLNFHSVLVWVQAGSFGSNLTYLCWKQKTIKRALKELNRENFFQIQKKHFKSILGPDILLSLDIHSPSSLFASGVSQAETDLISFSTGIPQGFLPVCYLGVPLCTNKLSISNCEMLIHQVTSRVTSWSVKSLSFAGRVLLIKTVIAGISSFWYSSIILPKACIMRINSLCSIFLWKGNIEGHHSARVSWETITKTKSQGVRYDIFPWIKLRVESGQNCRFWSDNWSPFGNIEDYLQGNRHNRLGISQSALLSSLQTMATGICLLQVQKIQDTIVWNVGGIPKQNFLAWLLILTRCPTKDRIIGWVFSTDPACILCNSTNESRDHLLFDCDFSWLIWENVARQCNLQLVRDWHDSISQMETLYGGNLTKRLTLLGWQATIYWI